jgi:hypothetical protein
VAVAVVPHTAVAVAVRLLGAAVVTRRLGAAAVPHRLHNDLKLRVEDSN